MTEGEALAVYASGEGRVMEGLPAQYGLRMKAPGVYLKDRQLLPFKRAAELIRTLRGLFPLRGDSREQGERRLADHSTLGSELSSIC